MSNIIKSNEPFVVDDLETLLKRRAENSTLNTSISRLIPQEIPKLQAAKGATLPDVIHMISELVTRATKQDPVIFEPDEGARPSVDQAVPLEQPHIYYEVIRRIPTLEIKPRERQEILDTDYRGKTRQGRVWGQRFECILQFNILAGDYKRADQVMNMFEDLIFNYTSYLKKNGVVEILFTGQLTDHDWDNYRQSLSIRSLQYRVLIEKLHAAFDTEEIDGLITG